MRTTHRTTHRTTRLLVVTAALGLGLAACGSYSSTPSSGTVNGYGAGASPSASASAATGSSTLTIQGFAFGAISVKAGSTVTVKNLDAVEHTVHVHGTTIDLHVSPSGTDSFVAPSKAGTYQLTCDFHHAMTGTLTVTA